MSEGGERGWGWLVAILVVSVGINCLLAGYIVGRRLLPGEEQATQASAPAPAQANNLAERLKALPKEERQKFQEAMRPFRPDIRTAREAVQEARDHLAAVISAEPYDPARMRETFEDVRAKAAVLQQKVQDATAQALAALSPESRKALAGP